jgi:hypothetical protein
MSTYPALNSMGIQNPKEIARYALYMVNNTDILRVVYDRKKGSILPVSKIFKFPMLKKSTMVDSGTRKTELIYESSAEFRNALSELNQLMDARSSSESLGNLIEEEIHALEEDVASRIAYIKSLVDKI